MLGEKDPQGVHLAQQAAGKPPGVIRRVMILVDQLAEPGIPRPPLPARGWGCGHMTETLQLGERPCPTGRYLGIVPGCQAPGRPDEMGQAGLPRLHPMAIHAVAVTDQDASPVVDEGRQGFFGPVGMNQVQRGGVTDHHPQPLEGVREKPGRFINGVHRGVPHLRGNRAVVRLHGLGHPVKHLLDRPQADRHPQHGGTKGLHHTPPIAIGPGHFAHERAAPGAIACGMFSWHLGFPPGAADGTPALMQDPVRYIHHDGRQCNHLMSMVWLGQNERRVPTGTTFGAHLVHGRGGQEHLAMAWMTRLPTSFARGRGVCTLAPLRVGRVRRRRPGGSRGILREPGFQAGDTLLQLTQGIMHGVQIGLYSRRGLFPVLWVKGNGQPGCAASDRGSMISPGGRQEGQTDRYGIPERRDQGQKKMLEEWETPSARTGPCHG